MDNVLKRALIKANQKYMAGAEEHGDGLEKADLPLRELIVMMQEEAIDQLMYCEAALIQLEKQDEQV